MPLTIKDLMSRMPSAFQPDKAEGVDAVLQFHFTGGEASDWYAVIKDQKCTVLEGVHEDPTMALTADSSDYIDVITGKQNAMQLFMAGKLKLKGNLNYAMKMMEYFKLN